MEKYITVKAAPQGKKTEKTREDTMDGSAWGEGWFIPSPCAIVVPVDNQNQSKAIKRPRRNEGTFDQLLQRFVMVPEYLVQNGSCAHTRHCTYKYN